MIIYKYQGKGVFYIRELAKKYESDFLANLYYSMLRIRLVEEIVESKYHEDQMKTPIHLAIGQEAIAVGSCAGLKVKDLIFCGHRTHANYLAKGGNLKAMIAEFFCRASGCVGSIGGSMHLLDKSVGMAGSSAIVAGAVPIATGAALSAKLKKEDRLTVVYLGDAATEEGAVWESLNFAVLKKLPIIYICENNYYSVCSPIGNRQPKGIEIYNKAAAFGLNSKAVDGNNVLEVYETVLQAAKHIQQDKGPCFIEAHTYRWRGHHGAGEDGHVGYRSSEEIESWKKHDPIEMLYEVLLERNDINKQKLQKMREEIIEEIKEAFIYAENSAEPVEADLFAYVYSD